MVFISDGDVLEHVGELYGHEIFQEDIIREEEEQRQKEWEIGVQELIEGNTTLIAGMKITIPIADGIHPEMERYVHPNGEVEQLRLEQR